MNSQRRRPSPNASPAFEQIRQHAKRWILADYAAREDVARSALTAKLSDAIWTSLEQAAERFGYVDRSRSIVDIGGSELNMDNVAAAAVDVFVEFLRGPPVREDHPDGVDVVRWPGGDDDVIARFPDEDVEQVDE